MPNGGAWVRPEPAAQGASRPRWARIASGSARALLAVAAAAVLGGVASGPLGGCFGQASVAFAATPSGHTAATALPPQATPPPPDLVALEQKMAAIHFNTEKFRLQEELSVELPGGTGLGEGPLTLLVAGEGSVSVSPSLATFRLYAGPVKSQLRIVGDREYRYEPSVASFDGHRPWVESRATATSGSVAGESQGIPHGAAGGSGQGTFAGLVSLLNSAESIEEAGPATVDDQPATQFVATVDPARIFTGKKGAKVLRELDKSGSLAVKLELFITANGLPLRTRVAVTAGKSVITITTDVLALEVPVSVQAPPAREVISEKRLKRLERRRVVCIRVPGPAGSRPHGSRPHGSRAQRKRRRSNGHHGKRARSHRICVHGAFGSGASEPETEATPFG